MDNDGPLRQNCDPTLPMAFCILANTCGYISNAIWFLVLLPQLIKNFRRQSTTGLSFIWASCNFTASLINLFFILDIQVPLFTRITGESLETGDWGDDRVAVWVCGVVGVEDVGG
ncbi:hypothetical protein BKA57DRAFT_440457 [Linnemannia elongata]|nr:hypothetical protein BKA57DRAFT_440457 [Linnemannia elongata]